MKHSSGQALLVVLLVLSVALTAGLSLVARTTSDISISQKETESNKAFEAAEAGIEKALKKIEEGITVSNFSIDEADLGNIGASSEVSLSDLSGNNRAIRTLYPGESATFWLNSFILNEEAFPNDGISWSGGNLNICWDDESLEKAEAIVYYQEGGQYKTERYYDGQSGVSCGEDFGQGLIISGLGSSHYFVNVRFYSDQTGSVRFTAAGEPNALPSQGVLINSQGQVSDVSRRLQVIKGWPELPDFFDFVLFSGGNLSK
ncbi:MAG: hypothetical protein XD98_0478 [Microgenomates bacterium 39_6]|nr:MAG: hypothetical protein XD98_0478 [Microgenomates bacterium 39_6]